MKKTKCNNLSILDQKSPMDLRQKCADYAMVYSFRESPVSDEFLMDLGFKAMAWAEENDDALVFNQFLRLHKISQEGWRLWCKRSAFLKTAYTYTLAILGDRREIAAMKHKLDPSFVMRSMPIYSDEWKVLNEWYAKLKEGQANQGQTIHVHMDPIPSPEKK